MGGDLLWLAIVFFLIAIVLGFFGFGRAASGFSSLAKILFVIFVILAIVVLLL